jgi:hypothetical protein
MPESRPYKYTIRARELARQLRRIKEISGLESREIADTLGWSQGKLSSILTGRVSLKEGDISALLAICHIIYEERDKIMSPWTPSNDPDRLRLASDEQWDAYLAHAKDAAALTEYQPFFIPWMLQVMDYTRALVAASPLVPTARLYDEVGARRKSLRLLSQPSVNVVLHEYALRALVGTTAVMSDQFRHLLLISIRYSLCVRVIPIRHNYPVSTGGPFSLMEFHQYDSIVYREEPAAGLFADNPHDVAAHRTVLQSLDTIALDRYRSRDLIEAIAADLDDTHSDGTLSGFLSPVIA